MTSIVFANSSSPIILQRRKGFGFIECLKTFFKAHSLLALICLFVAIIFAPERPQDLASICERHHPVIACQVW